MNRRNLHSHGQSNGALLWLLRSLGATTRLKKLPVAIQQTIGFGLILGEEYIDSLAGAALSLARFCSANPRIPNLARVRNIRFSCVTLED